MNGFKNQLTNLSTEKQKLFLMMLQAEGLSIANIPISKHGQQEKVFPLSYGQQRLWFLDQWDPGNPVYHLCGAVCINGPLQPLAIEASLCEIIHRHEVLRTTFTEHNGVPSQIVHPSIDWALPFHDLRATPASERQDQALHLLEQDARQPFILHEGPLLRALLLQTGEQAYSLGITLHHCIADGWSIGLLLQELSALYPDFIAGHPAALAPLPLQYADYALWQRTWLQEDTLDAHLNYWRIQLANCSLMLSLPTDHPRPANLQSKGRLIAASLDKELTQQLVALSQRTDVTLFMTLLASFQVLLARYSGQDDIVVGTPIAGRTRSELETLIGFFVNTLPLRSHIRQDQRFVDLLAQVRETTLQAHDHQDVPFEQLVDLLHPQRDPSRNPIVQVMLALQDAPTNGLVLQGMTLTPLMIDPGTSKFDLTFFIEHNEQGLHILVEYSTELFEVATIERMLEGWYTLLHAIVADSTQLIQDLPVISSEQQGYLLALSQGPQYKKSNSYCIHQLFEQQVELTPLAPALRYGDVQLSYQELNHRANRLAHYLHSQGIGPEMCVGICQTRSDTLLISLLAIHKAGAAYIPLDPTYPQERLDFVIRDAHMALLITQQSLLHQLSGYKVSVLCLEAHNEKIQSFPITNPDSGVKPENLAYVIYTSGSTGRPKGVAIQHSSVENFFDGLNANIPCHEKDTLLAVTSISFDISILELFWPLTRGAQVVILDDNNNLATFASPEKSYTTEPIDFSLFYFASNTASDAADQYNLLTESAKFADQHGFTAIWTPERHFHEFGGYYPNPSVMASALAMITHQIHLRAGSVVLPLHHPVRVAEEWSLVDNLSQGRVGISFASGWHADDFIFAPQAYHERKKRMFEGIEQVRALWEGRTLTLPGGSGAPVKVSIYPRPLQPTLPIWITSAGSKETFIQAGAIGANILTHLLGQTIEDVADNIAAYRASRAIHGFDPLAGCITLMIHTFLGENVEEVREKVAAPFIAYLKSSIGLLKNLAKNAGYAEDIESWTPDDLESLAAYAFDRYFTSAALFGTVDTCLPLIQRLKAVGVNEIASLIDFGVDNESTLMSLHHLDALRVRANRPEIDLPTLIKECAPALLQCTPSMMLFVLMQPAIQASLQSLRTLMLGGEALTPSVVQQVHETFSAQLLNMYGPTETTIWSAIHRVNPDEVLVPLGKPITNTQIYILDSQLLLVPLGVSGDIYIAGTGLARNYLGHPTLTAERFLPDSYSTQPGSRLYKTGDIGRYTSQGLLEFLGRSDQQVKIRGYRIEQGEIEAVLNTHPAIQSSIITVHEDSYTEKSILCYYIATASMLPTPQELRLYLRKQLPDYMLPAFFIQMQEWPLTPNGKTDRRALPTPEQSSQVQQRVYKAPRTPLEKEVAAIWSEVLGREEIGIDENFFELGGHSLLAAQLVARLRTAFGIPLPLKDFFEAGTIEKLATLVVQSLGKEEDDGESVEQLLAELENLSAEEVQQLLVNEE